MFEFNKMLGNINVRFDAGDSSVGLYDGFWVANEREGATWMNVDDLRNLHKLAGEALAAYDGQGQRVEGDFVDYHTLDAYRTNEGRGTE